MMFLPDGGSGKRPFTRRFKLPCEREALSIAKKRVNANSDGLFTRVLPDSRVQNS